MPKLNGIYGFLVFFVGTAVWASDNLEIESRKFTLGDHIETIIRFPARHLSLSASCRRPQEKLACDAYREYQKLKTGTLPDFKSDDHNSSANRGALICKLILHRNVLIAVSEEQNESSFCQFKDGSWLGTGSIAYAFSPKHGDPI